MDGSFGIVRTLRTLGTLRIAFGNKVAKNVASDIERLVPPLSPQIKICGDPIKKSPSRCKRRAQDISSNGKGITPYPNWLKAYVSMSGSAIGRSRERQRRVRLPPQGIA